jgi:hypothetical protein
MMDNQTTTRRHWITATARWGALGAVAAAWLRVSTSENGVAEQPCIDLKGQTGCRACGMFNNCGLPRALSVKHFLQGRADEPNS